MSTTSLGAPWWRTLALIAICPLAHAADAKPCEDREPERLAKFGYSATIEEIHNCLGDENDNSGISYVAATNSLAATDGTLDERVPKVISIVNQLIGSSSAHNAAASLNSLNTGTPNYWRLVQTALEKELARLHQPYTGLTDDTRRQWKLQIFSPDLWQLQQSGAVGLLPGTPPPLLTTVICPTDRGLADDCPAYKDRKDLLRTLKVAYRLERYLVADERSPVVAKVDLTDTKWSQYHDVGLYQWIWEDFLNGRLMTCAHDATGMQQGYCDVPHSTVIFLHPDVGVQWVSRATTSSDLHGAAYLEVFGKYSWTWSGNGQITSPHGWSAIAVYSNLTGQPKTGYGLMYHGGRDKCIAITVTGGHLGLLLSATLGDRLLTTTQDTRAKMKKALSDLQHTIH